MLTTHAVDVSDSRAFILPQKDLLARRRLFDALSAYRTKYEWWGYHLLCHFIIIVQRQLMQESIVAGVPIPWNAIKKSLPSMTYEDIKDMEEDGLVSSDYFSHAEHKCYDYYVGSVLYDLLTQSYEILALADIISQGCCNLVTGI